MSKTLKHNDAEEHKIPHMDANDIHMVNLNKILERATDKTGK